ncbi:DgyrCDS182 [Dimorphilus gyrociliatus]|uniref:DgyrCDS182 n=1 Tax=Dimorphilus gyrociliatus TaxID=2664684 RepID=A0A7I8V537_9ANNE|nr:DgyrCDS182 [Dimorphilus gyrociliatus]
MRGLKTFIEELRSCRNEDEERIRISKELANIRKKFLKRNKSLYDKRKYVCKLVYIFLKGEKVDFGQMEALSLISSTNYSDKRIGYLFLSTFPSREDYLLLAVECIKRDLHSNRPAIQKLALACLCNIGGPEMADLFTNQLVSVMKNEGNCDSVRQSSILGLISFLREGNNYPVILEKEIPYLFMIIDNDNLGLVQSSVTLLIYLTNDKNQLQTISSFQYLIISKLDKLMKTNNNFNQYMYGGFCAPWLIVQLFNLLNRIQLRENITNLIEYAIEKSIETKPNVTFIETNIKISIFQEAVKVDIICSFPGDFFRWDVIWKMILFLPRISQFSLRQELVNKILFVIDGGEKDVEQYAPALMNLISIAGDVISSSCWFKLVKLIREKPFFQKKVAAVAFNLLNRKSNPSSVLLRMCSFIIGEYGYLIASGREQIDCLRNRFYQSDEETKSIMLSAFVKIAQLHTNIKVEVLNILNDEMLIKNLNTEVQQRAVEYYQLIASFPSNFTENILLERASSNLIYKPEESFRQVLKVADISKRLKKTDFVLDAIRDPTVKSIDDLYDKRWSDFYHTERILTITTDSLSTLKEKLDHHWESWVKHSTEHTIRAASLFENIPKKTTSGCLIECEKTAKRTDGRCIWSIKIRCGTIEVSETVSIFINTLFSI